jgi:hypothetical protein
VVYALRRHCGLSAREVLHELPSWEVELLMEGLNREVSADG